MTQELVNQLSEDVKKRVVEDVLYGFLTGTVEITDRGFCCVPWITGPYTDEKINHDFFKENIKNPQFSIPIFLALDPKEILKIALTYEHLFTGTTEDEFIKYRYFYHILCTLDTRLDSTCKSEIHPKLKNSIRSDFNYSIPQYSLWAPVGSWPNLVLGLNFSPDKKSNLMIIPLIKNWAQQQEIQINEEAVKSAIEHYSPGLLEKNQSDNTSQDQNEQDKNRGYSCHFLFSPKNSTKRVIAGLSIGIGGVSTAVFSQSAWLATAILGTTLNPITASVLLALGLILALTGTVLFSQGLNHKEDRNTGFAAIPTLSPTE